MTTPGPHDDAHPAEDPGVTADEVTCRQFVELITDYFEGTLSDRTLSRVEEHLVICDWCGTYLAQMRATIDSLRTPEHESAPEPSASVLAALRARAARK